MKNKCAAAYCFFSVKSRMMRSTFWFVGINKYMASNSGWSSRWLVIDSMTCIHRVDRTTDNHKHFRRTMMRQYIRVTFSWRISNCFNTDPSSFCANSSTTRIFHRPGGFTDRIASRNSVDQNSRKWWHRAAISSQRPLKLTNAPTVLDDVN